MKLLLENWKKYIKEEIEYYDSEPDTEKEREELEQKHFGVSSNIGEMLHNIYQNEITRLDDDGLDFHEIMDEHDNIFDYIQTKFNKLSPSNKIVSNDLENFGRGCFRAVFSCDKDFVIKIDASIDGTGADMNREDFQLGTKAKYGDIFPRVFKHDPNFTWIVAEKVTPIQGNEVILINNKFPNPLLRKNMIDTRSYLTMIQTAIRYKVAQMKRDDGTIHDCARIFDYGKQTLAMNSYVTIEKVIKEFNKNPLFYKIVSAVFEYGIEVEDSLRPHNTGIGSDGRLVILDSSIEDTLNIGRQAIP